MTNRNRHIKRKANKNNCKKNWRQSTKGFIKGFLPWSYYLVTIGIIVFVMFCIRPCIMTWLAKNEIHSISGTIYQVAQNKDYIEHYIFPYVFALSTLLSVFISFLINVVLTIFYSKKGVFAPFLDICVILATVLIALSGVYTWGYDAAKEINYEHSKMYAKVFDVASGINASDNSKTTITAQVSITETDKTDGNDDSVKNDETKSPSVSEDYFTMVDGKQTDFAKNISNINDTISLIFACVASYIIPLNIYLKAKEDMKE